MSGEKAAHHARAVARNPGDTVLIRGEPPRSVERWTPRLQRVGSGIEASDAIAEQLRPPDAVVGSGVTAVGDGNGETHFRRVGFGQAVVRPRCGRRVEEG